MNQSAGHILVVDDDPTVTSVLKRGLTYEGFSVDTANSGSQAFAIARDHAPDLAILDVMLPGAAGYQVLARLRAADSGLPVLMLTARDAASDQVKGLESGADGGEKYRFVCRVYLPPGQLAKCAPAEVLALDVDDEDVVH